MHRVPQVRFRLSHFDPKGPLDAIASDTICSDYALALSQDGVTQSATLLKNAKGALPIAREAQVIVARV